MKLPTQIDSISIARGLLWPVSPMSECEEMPVAFR